MTSYPDLPSIQPVAEYEIHLFAYFHTVPVYQGQDDFLYAALKTMCHIFGLDEQDEISRIQQHTILKTQLVIMETDKELKQICLRLGFIGTWLLNLPIEIVEKTKDKNELTIFQQNAAQILEEAFCEGRLTEWPLIANLLEHDSPAVAAYKKAVAMLGLARDQLVLDAKSKNILCD